MHEVTIASWTLTSELEDLSRQVLHDRSDVDGGLGTDADIVGILVSQEPVFDVRTARILP